VQTDLQRCEWLRQHGWKVEGEAVIDGQPVRWIEHDKGNRTAWLRIVDGVILWHGAEDQEWEAFVAEHYLNLETIMTEETTTSEQLAEIEPQPEPVQVREGRWKTRDGEVRNVTPTPEGDGLAERWPWWDAADRHFWRANGRYYFDGKGPLDLVAYLGPIESEPQPEPQPQPERQATQYTPPEGWRLVEVGETLTLGDEIVQSDDGRRYPTERVGSIVVANQRYIRRIEPQPEEQPQPRPQPVQVREGRWQTRNGEIFNVTPTPECDSRAERFPWWDGIRLVWTSKGRYYLDTESPFDLLEYLGPIEPQPEPQAEPQATEYTPPEGWRVVRFGEQLLPGDMWVHQDGTEQRSAILHWDASAVSGGRCIRRIKQQPEPQPTTDDPSGPGWRDVEPDELLQDGDMLKNNTGLWLRTRVPGRFAREGFGGTYRRRIEPQTTPDDPSGPGWRDVEVGEVLRDDDMRQDNGGRWRATSRFGQPAMDERTYRRRIEQQPEPQPNAAAIEELRSEVAYVQRLLGSEKRRVAELEELVTSLRTINAAQEKAVDAAGKENTALRNQLAVAKEELTIAAAVSHQLQIELDAAQQVPVDSPDLQQLQLRLADMTLDRDQYKTAWNQIFTDLTTIRETTAAETVEAIVEWLQPFRGCNSPSLALLLLEALPHIMRSLTGLADEEIE
jgi:hypothetical protein